MSTALFMLGVIALIAFSIALWAGLYVARTAGRSSDDPPDQSCARDTDPPEPGPVLVERSERLLFLIPDDSIAGVTNPRQRHVDDVGETDTTERAPRQLEDAVVGQ
jgi:hypothetical protein